MTTIGPLVRRLHFRLAARTFLGTALFVCLAIPKSVLTNEQARLELLSHLSFPVEKVRDVWGFERSNGTTEYALIGYRSGNDRGIYVVDVSEPATPKIVSTVKSVPSFDVKTFNEYAYAVYGTPEPTARVIDLSHPDDPRVVGSFPSAHNITIDDNGYMYLENPGLRIFDLNPNPTSPVLIWDDGDLNQDGHDAAVFGDRLYDFHGRAGTRIYNIVDPRRPQLLGLINDPAISFHHSGWATEAQEFLLICDELAKSDQRPADISVWDIRDLGNPVRVGQYADSSATVHNLYLVGKYAFIAYYTAGLKVLDVSNPESPVEVAAFDTAPNDTGPELIGAFGVYPFLPSGHILVSDTKSGLFVFSFSPPSDSDTDTTETQPAVPVIVSFQPARGTVGTRVTVSGDAFKDVLEVTMGGATISDFSVNTESEIVMVVPAAATSGLIRITTVAGIAQSASAFTLLFPPQGPATYQFRPTDDSFVWSRKPQNLNGQEDELRVRTTGKAEQYAYLKFNVAGLTSAIVRAKLRLYVLDGSEAGGDLYLVSNSYRNGQGLWTEDGLLWVNAPALHRPPLSSLGAVALNTQVEIDVTPAIAGNGIFSFGIKNESSDVARYASEESPHPPELIIETAATDPSPKITSFLPLGGSSGMLVTILGKNFTAVRQVSFGGTSAMDFTVDAATQIRALVPAGAVTGRIQVTAVGGTAGSATDFLVHPLLGAKPRLDGFEPRQARVRAQIALDGRNLAGATAVLFNGTPANFEVASNERIVTSVPEGASTGPITIATPADTTKSQSDFTVLPSSESGVSVLAPTDDAFVWSKRRENNYAGWPELRVRETSEDQIAYLKFRWDMSGPISEAKLRLVVIDGGPEGGALYLASNNFSGTNLPWHEEGLDFNNAPVVHGASLGQIGLVSAGDTVEIDVTSVISGSGVYSFALQNGSDDAVKYSSKEGVASPELVIATDSPDRAAAPTLKEDHQRFLGALSREQPDLPVNYPNPFNTETTIRYVLTWPTNVRLEIFNSVGQRVRRLLNEPQDVGPQMARWSGRNDWGAEVASGIYFFVLTVDAQPFSGKLLLLR